MINPRSGKKAIRSIKVWEAVSIIIVLTLLLYMVSAVAFAKDRSDDSFSDLLAQDGFIAQGMLPEMTADNDSFGTEDSAVKESAEDPLESTGQDELTGQDEPSDQEGFVEAAAGPRAPVRVFGSNATFASIEAALAMLDSNGGGVLEITGDMTVSHNLHIPSNIIIRGAGGQCTVTFALGSALIVQGGVLTLGGGSSLTLTGTANPVQVKSGLLEVARGASIVSSSGNAVSVSTGSVVVSGGTVAAYGDNTAAVQVGNGSVVVLDGTVKAYGDYVSAIRMEYGDITVYDGLVSATSRIGHSVYAIRINQSGTAKVVGGSISATGCTYGDNNAIYLRSKGMAAYLRGTCSGDFAAWNNTIIVEVESIRIPNSYEDTTIELRHIAGKPLSNVVWNCSGDAPTIVYSGGIYSVPWGVLAPHKPPVDTDRPARLVAPDMVPPAQLGPIVEIAPMRLPGTPGEPEAQLSPASTTYTVAYLPGSEGTFEPRVIDQLSVGDATPAAPETTGNAGWYFDGWLPKPVAEVTGDVVYVAQWTTELAAPIVASSANPDEPAAGSDSAQFASTASGFENRPEQELRVTSDHRIHETQEGLASRADEEGIPQVQLLGLSVPLIVPAGYGAWSLANFILTAFSVLVLAVLGVRALNRNKTEDREEYSDYGEFVEPNKATKVSPILFVVGVVAAKASLLLFFLTQDMTLPLVVFDLWTYVYALLFVFSLIASILAVRKEEREIEEPEEAHPADYLKPLLMQR